MTDTEEIVRSRVKERYATAARSTASTTACCGSDYSTAELELVPTEAVLGLGSGNPVRHAHLQAGEVVVDLGSGAGIDVFLAARQVGLKGRVVGVDMTPTMVARARRAATRGDFTNVEFHEAVIERLPLPDATADVVLSNCVVNLSPDKSAAFREAFRVLRPGGRMIISDIVQERSLGPMDDDCGCVATAMVRGDYLQAIREAGFQDLEVLEDRPWRYGTEGVEASAITLRSSKPRA